MKLGGIKRSKYYSINIELYSNRIRSTSALSKVSFGLCLDVQVKKVNKFLYNVNTSKELEEYMNFNLIQDFSFESFKSVQRQLTAST